MKLDKFQQFVKDYPIYPYFNPFTAKLFVKRLISDFPGKSADIESNVNGSVEFGEIYSNSLHCVESLSVTLMDNAIKLHVNELIVKTLEEIEDIEEVNKMEPEDCMDIDKRAKELDQ